MIHIGKPIVFNSFNCFQKNKHFLLKIKNEMASLERIISNNSIAEELLKSLKSQVNILNGRNIFCSS